MNKKTLVILGAGPRGLACAIQALKYKEKFNIYIIDPTPISTWKFPNMVINMKMRSPITFDLVTYQKDLEEYSLSNFLGILTKKDNQEMLESNTTFCSRAEFVDYLEYCKNKLIKEGINLIKNKPLEISRTEIKFNKTQINYNYLIIATGKYTEEIVTPNYLKGLTTCVCNDMYTSDWNNKRVYVVGSGQFSSEIVDYLTDNIRSQLYWVTKYNQKIEQYPVPNFKHWNKLSALGTYYYKNLDIYSGGSNYLALTKKWGPTLTPHIKKQLDSKSTKFGITDPLNIPLDKSSIYVLALGRKQNLYKLPFNFRFPNSITRENVPNVTKDFNTYLYPNIYFTGQLALEAGGPQQGSIISSGFTGDIIMRSILFSL